MNLENKKISYVIVILLIIFFILVSIIFNFTILKYSPVNEEIRKEFLNLSSNKRSDIIDRNGNLIATNIKTKNLYLRKELIEDIEDISKKLGKYLNIDSKELYNKIINSKSKNILIKRNLFLKEEEFINNFPIAGINFENDSIRYYLQDNLFSNVVGYVDLEEDGKFGLEEYYNDYLNMGIAPLQLTFDIQIQHSLRNELLKAQKEYSSNFVLGIISEIETGNILGMVTIPDYNPNKTKERANSFNKAIQGLYELGSVMKIFTITNGLKEKVIKENTMFNVEESIKYDNFIIKEGRQVKKKNLNLGEAFALSSNIAVVQIAQKLGIEKQIKFFDTLGLLEKINLDSKQIQLPKQPRRWKEINLITIAYGYGIALSPLHIIQGVNAILNDGNFISPRFSYQYENQTKKNILSKEVSDIMKTFFQLNTKNGTGKNAYIEGYNVGGKTGTAEKVIKTGYAKGEHLATFIGVFPMDKPKYSILVVIDRPKGEDREGVDAGGRVPARIVKNIILNIIPFLNIKPE